jgi:hypothetical protein
MKIPNQLAAGALALAALLHAQPAAKPILGTVTKFKAGALEMGVQPDTGAALFFKFGPETEIFRIPPGERDLSKSKPARVTDIAPGDRVLVSFVEGMAEARRIVLVAAGDIAQRNESERLDWQKRGVSGVVAAKNGSEVTLEVATPEGKHNLLVAITPQTRIRRYAPDSVKFADAERSSLAEINRGDQLRLRGDKSADGSKVTAEEVVFGTFLTKIGTITAVDKGAREIRILDLATKSTVTIRLTADTRLKKMEFGGGPPSGGEHRGPPAPSADRPFDMSRMLEQLPPATLDDLKAGGAVVVTGTRSAKEDALTAIMLLANADALVQMAQSQAAAHPGMSPMDVLGRLHGGMLSGPGGVSLPAMLP